MYRLVRITSVFLRTFMFPNPFEKCITFYLQSTMYISASFEIAYIFNLVVGGTLLWGMCYPLVGIVYKSRECPIIGSIIFMILVLLNSQILVMISKYIDEFEPYTFLLRFTIAVCIEIIALIGIGKVRNYARFF